MLQQQQQKIKKILYWMFSFMHWFIYGKNETKPKGTGQEHTSPWPKISVGPFNNRPVNFEGTGVAYHECESPSRLS
jgi:hypothetical protein